MCGLVAIYNYSRPIVSAQLQAAASAIRHRGPDSQSLWVAAHGRVGLAFNRLAIVGPNEETQPFHDSTRQVSAVINGEIYGYRAARASLERAGARFATQSDCEVVLQSYLQSGSACVEQLNGEYAFVIWDERRQRLIAARDRWGVKPLFYRSTPDGIILASEVKAIVATSIAPRWDAESVHQHLFASMSPGRTLFSGIRQLEPGQLMVVAEGNVRLSKYWDIDYDSGSAEIAGPSLLEELRTALDVAVADRLQGNHPVAVYLSGGVDSSVIAALSSTKQESTLAFTVDFGQSHSEGELARAVAERVGARHEVLSVGEEQLVRHFEDSVWHAETIGFNSIGVAKYLLSRQVQRLGRKVVLSGDGADELFGGYAFSVMDAMVNESASARHQLIRTLEESNAALSAALDLPLQPFEIDARLFGDAPVPFLLTSWSYGRCVFRELLAEEFVRPYVDRNPYEHLIEQLGCAHRHSLHGLKRSMYIWQKSLFCTHILAAERLDMAHSVESRYPFLDNRVVAVARRLLDASLVSGYRDKIFLRIAAESWLPPSARNRAKQPFEAPYLSARPDGEFAEYLQDTLTDRALRNSGVFNAQAIRDLLNRWQGLPPKIAARMDMVMMAILSVLALEKRFGITTG